MHRSFIVSLAFLAAAAASAQQHHHHAPGGSPGDRASTPSPYAGEQRRAIKALSAPEEKAWLDGEGQGLAKAAELNGYPGPAHVLELAEPLALTPAQASATRELLARHKAQVRALGAELVDAERRLDTLFASKQADAAAVDRLTGSISALQARVRASHLVTHIEQTALLRPEQVERYQRLRGYAR